LALSRLISRNNPFLPMRRWPAARPSTASTGSSRLSAAVSPTKASVASAVPLLRRWIINLASSSTHTYWNQFTGLDVSQIAGEGEYYFGRWTVQGIAGIEFGNSASRITTTTAGTLTETYDIKTRFFDEINFAYYLTDNWKAFVGHRYLGGKNALALGTEYAFQVQPGLFGSLFVEGRLGDDNSQGVWGGVRFYFGQRDKTLMARHREDDPIKWTPSSLFSISNSQSKSFVATAPCTPTEILIDGVPVLVCI
jgi:hypothetical protein